MFDSIPRNIQSKQMDLEDEIFGSPEKETPLAKTDSTVLPRKESIITQPPVVIPHLNLSKAPSEKKITSPKKKPSILDMEDEIFEQKQTTPKKTIPSQEKQVVDLEDELFTTTPKRKPTVVKPFIPSLQLGHTPSQDAPMETPKETPKGTTPKTGIEKLNSIRSKTKLENIPEPISNPVTLTSQEMKNLTHEEQAQLKRVRSRSQRRSTKMTRKQKDVDDFDGLEYIRAVKKEGYLIKPNSDGSKAYKRYCVATKLGDGKVVFLMFSSKKAVADGDPISKFLITEDVTKESSLFKTQKKSTSYDAGKEFHDCIVIRQGKLDPVKFWTMDDFDAREWELTLKCMMYFDEDSGDDESDSDDDEKTKKEKRQRRRKREIEKIKEREERKKTQGCFGKLWNIIKE